jgi:D-alanine-D-alanine ligase
MVRVTVLFNQPVLSSQHPEADSESWVATAVDDIARRLVKAGLHVTTLGAGRDLSVLQQHLTVSRADVVFNLFEGLADRPESEIEVARLLEELHIPFTGSGSEALQWALYKPLTKQHLQAADLPTPWFRVAKHSSDIEDDLPWPVIVKPAQRDASEGIEQANVVTDRAALTRRVSNLVEEYGSPVLIEEFLPGREFTVALLETPQLVTLPISEVQFGPPASMLWPILSYTAKWMPGSPDYEATAMEYRADVSPELTARLNLLATRAFRALDCRDYARVDLRLSRSGTPMILEVNANPDMSPTACFAGALASAGLDRTELIVGLVRRALARGGKLSTQRCG